MSIEEQIAAQNAVIESLCADEEPLLFDGRSASLRYLVHVSGAMRRDHPDLPEYPEWRVTVFDGERPVGHTTHATKRSALRAHRYDINLGSARGPKERSR